MSTCIAKCLGRLCGAPAAVFDPERGGMVCPAHAPTKVYYQHPPGHCPCDNAVTRVDSECECPCHRGGVPAPASPKGGA